jgi:hypothetical protein
MLPPSTQGFLMALLVLVAMTLGAMAIAVFSRTADAELSKTVISGGMDLCKVLVGAFAGSLAIRSKTSNRPTTE